jgi:PBP1b-binding outer membrane lipoprotein LpoB
MKRIITILLGAAFLVACNSFAKDAPKANPFDKVLTAVPAAELPSKAAELV